MLATSRCQACSTMPAKAPARGGARRKGTALMSSSPKGKTRQPRSSAPASTGMRAAFHDA